MTSIRMLFIFVSVLFLVGFVFGCLTVLFMPIEQKAHLGTEMNLMFDHLERFITAKEHAHFWEQTKKYLFIGITFFFLGLSVIGVPLIFLFVIVKGFIIGFSSSFIIYQLGVKGIFFVLYSILPQNLILIPTILFYSVCCSIFALFIVQNRLLKFQGRLRPQLISYFAVSLGLTAILVIVSVYEYYLAPILLEKAL